MSRQLRRWRKAETDLFSSRPLSLVHTGVCIDGQHLLTNVRLQYHEVGEGEGEGTCTYTCVCTCIMHTDKCACAHGTHIQCIHTCRMYLYTIHVTYMYNVYTPVKCTCTLYMYCISLLGISFEEPRTQY